VFSTKPDLYSKSWKFIGVGIQSCLDIDWFFQKTYEYQGIISKRKKPLIEILVKPYLRCTLIYISKQSLSPILRIAQEMVIKDFRL
jgi:hypothetical protein